MRPAINTQSLSLGYGDKLIINDMNIEIPKGRSPYSSVLMDVENQHF